MVLLHCKQPPTQCGDHLQYRQPHEIGFSLQLWHAARCLFLGEV